MRKLKKILIASDYRKPWNPGYYIKKGFEKNKIDVFTFDPLTSTNAYHDLLRTVIDSKPDVLFYIKNYGLKPEWLLKIKQRGILLVQWYIDLAIPDWLPPFVQAADIFFTMSEGLVDEFKKYNPNVFWLTQAFEPSFFEIKEIPREDVNTFSTEVTFVGNLGSKHYYLKRRRYLERVINEGFKLKWWGPRIPRKLSTIPLILGKLGRSYGGKFVWGEEYAKVAKLSKVFLAFDAMPHIRKSMSARMYTAVGCAAFYMSQHVDGIEEVLEPDKEIVTFHSEDEMIDKIKYYLPEEEKRKKVAEAGRQRVLKEHTYEIRLKEMLSIIEKNR